MIIKTSTENVIKNMSYTEMKALKALVAELEGARDREIIVSKIAEAAFVTRSVFVNVVRKLEVSGVIETESMGVKGMYIKINNREALDIIAEG